MELAAYSSHLLLRRECRNRKRLNKHEVFGPSKLQHSGVHDQQFLGPKLMVVPGRDRARARHLT